MTSEERLRQLVSIHLDLAKENAQAFERTMEDDDETERLWSINAELVAAIVSIRNPAHVADIKQWESEDLIAGGLAYLIEGAAGYYDDVQGYLDSVYWDHLALGIKQMPPLAGPIELCSWIDANVPLVSDAAHFRRIQ